LNQFYGKGKGTNDVLVENSNTDFIMPDVGSSNNKCKFKTSKWKATT
jgi:hypothetical protein